MNNYDKKSVIGLGLESSCDETSASIVESGNTIISNKINTQIDLHKEFNGVVPEIASRAHLEIINILIKNALDEAGIEFSALDYVAATSKPGLIGSLLVGLQSAKAISYTLQIPLIAVNHLEAHLYAPFLEGNPLRYPFIGLLVSGGNCNLYIIRDAGEMELLGKTADDAVGEAFDKVSKYLNLGYPGGPVIENLAKKSTDRPVLFSKILANSDDFRFSYSGIKTAVINYLKENPNSDYSDIVYSFQERSFEVLVRKVFKAARDYDIRDIVVAGGVAANRRLREMMQQTKMDYENIIFPSPLLCTDNAAMVAGMGYHYFIRGINDDLSVDAQPRV